MFRWRRSGGQASGDRNEPAEGPKTDLQPVAVGDDQALDAFVQVLRAFGQHAFEIDRENVVAFSEQCAAWGRHLLTLVPPPVGSLTTGAADKAVDRGAVKQVARRDWAGVVQFLVARRKREQAHINTALSELRQGLWTFAQSLGMALVEDQQMDTRLQAQIERLKVALERLSPEELREEVTVTASNLSGFISERQRRQRERLEALGAKVADLTSQLHEAKAASARDPLTQLTNRKGFDEFLSRMVFMRDVFAETACLMMIDIDHFKAVNDTFGHQGGDAVLRAIADNLARNFPRKSDLVARYGGEEFAVILPDTSLPDAKRLAERMLATIRALNIPYSGHMITVTASAGLSQLGRSESIQDWLDRADQALYRAKAEGRDRVAETAIIGA